LEDDIRRIGLLQYNLSTISIILLELREGEKEREKERERERNLWKVDTRKELQKEKEILELEVIL
jgi:hypothetical protein